MSRKNSFGSMLEELDTNGIENFLGRLSNCSEDQKIEQNINFKITNINSFEDETKSFQNDFNGMNVMDETIL